MSENSQAKIVQAKAAAAGGMAPRVLPFLSPEVAAEATSRVLFNNSRVRAADPIYQRGIVETSTVDVGDHQNRAVLVVPHQACPVLVSHTAQAGVGTLFHGKPRAGRLVDVTKGIYAGTDAVAPPFRAFEVPADWAGTTGTRFPIPIHGAWYTAAAAGSGLVSTSSTQFRDFTDQLVGGVSNAKRAIPVQSGDFVSIKVEFQIAPIITVTDLVLEIVTIDATGARTATTANAAVNNLLPTSGMSAIATVPVGAVGLAAASLLSAATVIRRFSSIVVQHSTSSGVVDLSMALGSYTGVPISGLASLAPVCTAGRVTALSAKVTNTASALNANGFIIANATQDATPAAIGCFGESSIASLASSKSFKFTDGSYMALAPSIDLEYMPLDSAPSENMTMGIFVVQTQDNTPITFKVEYHMMFEVVSQDPLFAPHKPLHDAAQIAALAQAQEAGGYLVLSENPFHWGSIATALSKVGKGVGGFAKSAGSAAMSGARAIARNPGTALAIGASLGVPGAMLAQHVLSGRALPRRNQAVLPSSGNMGAVPQPGPAAYQQQPRGQPMRARAAAVEHRPWGMARSQWHAMGH
jgi:hypothetical protein